MRPFQAPAGPGLITEKQLLDWLIELAHVRGWATYHAWLSVHSASGWPDVALCRPPRFVVAELKSEKGRTTVAQNHWLDMLAECGVEAYLWRPSHRDEIERVLA